MFVTLLVCAVILFLLFIRSVTLPEEASIGYLLPAALHIKNSKYQKMAILLSNTLTRRRRSVAKYHLILIFDHFGV